MPGEALLDAAVESQVDDGAQIDESSSQVDDSAGQDSDAQSENQTKHDDSAPVIADSNGQLRLSETAKAKLDEIKAENPKLAREMRAALFDRQTLAQKGLTVKQALETIEAYEAEGGSEAVQQVKQELGLWKNLDADFQAGKPEFVNDIANGNPEAFVKLAPHVMSKFAEMAPEVYSHEVAKVFAQDIAANDVVMTLRLLQREIGLLPEASRKPVLDLWTQLATYVDRVNNLAKQAPKTETKTSTANPTGNSDLDQREQALTIQEFSAERARVYNSVVESEFKKNLGTRKATQEQTSAIRELFDSRLDKILRSDKNHTAKVDRFLAAKDKPGYSKHMQAMYRAKAPLAMEQAFKAVMPGKPGPAPKPVAKPAGTAKPATQTTGFTRVATKPAHNDVNWPATNSVRRTKEDGGKYVLRDGSRVLFQR